MKKKVLAAVLGAAFSLQSIFISSAGVHAKDAQAAPAQNAVSVKGDVNGDGVFDITDAEIFLDWLLGGGNAAIADLGNADFYEDGVLNAVDLSFMQKSLWCKEDRTVPDIADIAVMSNEEALQALQGFSLEEIELAWGRMVLSFSGLLGGCWEYDGTPVWIVFEYEYDKSLFLDPSFDYEKSLYSDSFVEAVYIGDR